MGRPRKKSKSTNVKKRVDRSHDRSVYLDGVTADVKANGHSIQGTAAEIDRKRMFVHTVGLDPELVLVGINPKQAAAILDAIVQSFRMNGERPKVGEYEGVFLDRPMRLRQCGTRSKPFALNVAHSWRKHVGEAREFDALQIVYTDEQNRFPDDDGYDAEHYPQPMIGEA